RIGPRDGRRRGAPRQPAFRRRAISARDLFAARDRGEPAGLGSAPQPGLHFPGFALQCACPGRVRGITGDSECCLTGRDPLRLPADLPRVDEFCSPPPHGRSAILTRLTPIAVFGGSSIPWKPDPPNPLNSPPPSMLYFHSITIAPQDRTAPTAIQAVANRFCGLSGAV